MLYAFLALAAQSPTRQKSFRTLVVAHLGLLLAIVWAAANQAPAAPSGGTFLLAAPKPRVEPLVLAGHLLLCAGIVEGALLARELINEPANVLGPAEFASRAKTLTKVGVEISVLTPKAL